LQKVRAGLIDQAVGSVTSLLISAQIIFDRVL
jgi:hypothetical protein